MLNKYVLKEREGGREGEGEGRKEEEKANPVICYEDGLGRGNDVLSKEAEELEVIRWEATDTSWGGQGERLASGRTAKTRNQR